MNLDSVAWGLLFSTVRIETDAGNGLSTGTSFLYEYESRTFLITNKHVLAGATVGRFFLTLSDGTKPIIGQKHDVVLQNFEQRWHGHPDPAIDIAVFDMTAVIDDAKRAGVNLFYCAIPDGGIPSQSDLDDFDAIDEITFIGYPNGMYDRTNLLPVTRRGTIATPFQVDYEGEPKFLIDASVFPGSSGSPVFLFKSGGTMLRNKMIPFYSHYLRFLGVIASVAVRREVGEYAFVPVPTQPTPTVLVKQMIDLGIVVKSSTVIETIKDYLKKP